MEVTKSNDSTRVAERSKFFFMYFAEESTDELVIDVKEDAEAYKKKVSDKYLGFNSLFISILCS